jgi:hypothetical protein
LAGIGLNGADLVAQLKRLHDLVVADATHLAAMASSTSSSASEHAKSPNSSALASPRS